jgi:hypothetical protein
MTQTTLPLPRFATEGLALLASADRHRLCRQRERVLLILGIVLAGVGFLHAATRKEMLLQALGLVGFGAMALLAAGATPLLGAYVAALGLLSHAVWDEYHHHADPCGRSLIRAVLCHARLHPGGDRRLPHHFHRCELGAPVVAGPAGDRCRSPVAVRSYHQLQLAFRAAAVPARSSSADQTQRGTQANPAVAEAVFSTGTVRTRTPIRGSQDRAVDALPWDRRCRSLHSLPQALGAVRGGSPCPRRRHPAEPWH